MRTRHFRTSRTSAQRYTALKLGWIALVLFLASSVHASTQARDLRFAQEQIRQFESLLGDLSERSENDISSRSRPRMRNALIALDLQLSRATSSLSQATRHHDPFAIEKLRANIISLQDCGRHAFEIMIESDSAQGLTKRPTRKSIAGM